MNTNLHKMQVENLKPVMLNSSYVLFYTISIVYVNSLSFKLWKSYILKFVRLQKDILFKKLEF